MQTNSPAMKTLLRFEEQSLSKSYLDIFDQEQWPVLNVVGNHELYNFEKDSLYKSRLFKNLPSSNKAYYTLSPYQGLKVCVLNTYEISVLGELEGTATYDVAHLFLAERNPNKDKNDPSGLESVDRRFVRFNGAVSKEQLEWLSKELILATKQKENVIVVAKKVLLKFGVVADLQYANIEDGYNWNGTKMRYYRSSLNLLQKAMKDWKQK
ncbi:manganese-dependent ADP-ribose/CDP-alcohol diphosphatase [Mytilus galloprovincialis]|uniref:Manganese-dependent ADP-ribose/CDP-alcohol diphosphatase n=1 Tax=Mytilus galloprovincialis TaxID=29158 RepID=A0A8B6BWD3_MYTGA|nr:manganese-dependent ADP-ribose/CDP-alcohol diphosphatase [Mytilus galloprovincialis]